MNKEEAAETLGISVRSLQRKVSEGKLSVAYQRGDSGKMEAVFDAEDVARYAVQMREIVKPEREANSL
jgi:predicted site-specific integrase-resolvase